MTTPRIGDTVHYVSHGTPIQSNGTQAYRSLCRAAIITAWVQDDTPSTGPAIASITVLNPTGMFFIEQCVHDRDAEATSYPFKPLDTDNLTPGTWHHIH